MQVQIKVGGQIERDRSLAGRIEEVVRAALDRFSAQITRVELHLRDENSKGKSGPADKRCTLEVRLAGRRPMAVTHHAPTVEQAVDGASGRMQRALDSSLGRLADR